ncbi:DDE-type integrase/transposase/recombinase [Spiroplasma apis]|uniref:Putative transposase n=1 Tax=Spiroplasma apis B31 TaxID=1276258 RepID=V5RKW7_SPIAP|nr:DDE-type integrase/transposase/recombinase [Spiroplasma apis]AHB36455.1 putative transposase [Spiroplasma apis B31]
MVLITLIEIDLCIQKISFELQILHIYLSIKNFVYFSVFKDENTEFIVVHEVSLKKDIDIYRKTLEKVSFHRQDLSKKLIIYSDNGSQYTPIFAKRYAKKNNIIISLSRPCNSIDNGICGTFFSSLKEK